MASLTRSHSSLYPSYPSLRDEDEYQELLTEIKKTLKTEIITREQSDALDQAIYILTCKCFEEFNNPCETLDDVSEMFSKVLSTYSFRHMIYSKSSDSQLIHLSLTIEKQQAGFSRIIDFFWRMVSQKNPRWNYCEFCSSFQESSQSSTDDFFQIKIFNRPRRKTPFFEPPKLPTSISKIILELGNSQSYDFVDSSSIPEEPSLPLTLGQRLSQLNLKERFSTFTTGLGALFSSTNSTKSE